MGIIDKIGYLNFKTHEERVESIRKNIEKKENEGSLERFEHDTKRMLARYDRDHEKNIRIKIFKKCKYCHYVASSIGLDSIKSYNCNGCNKTCIHDSTATPSLCEDCAEKMGRCKYCYSRL